MMSGASTAPAERSVKATVIVACYDANDTLGLQLEALARQEDAPPFEVIVVDNMSSESPRSVTDRFRDRLNIRIVVASEAQGVSAARNVGLREARALKVVVCDADDCAGPRFVAEALAALRVGDVVTGNVVTLDSLDFEPGVDHIWSILAARSTSGPPVAGVVDPTYPILMGGACALDRAVALRLGGFDQSFFPGAEDNDLALRATRAGYDIITAPAMTLAERRRATSAAAFRRSYAAGRMHMRLCAAHDLWSTSPHLHNPEWWLDLLRLPVVGGVMILRDRRGADWWGLASRAGLRAGQAVGYWQFKVRCRSVSSQPGVGLRA